jgi:hypothetical protein
MTIAEAEAGGWQSGETVTKREGFALERVDIGEAGTIHYLRRPERDILSIGAG